MTALHPSYNESSAWCQGHGRPASSPTAACAAFAENSELRELHNLDGRRRRRNGHTGPHIPLIVEGGRHETSEAAGQPPEGPPRGGLHSPRPTA